MLLIDTHTLIWFLYNDKHLPTGTVNKLKTTPNVYVSIASVWEIAIKQGIGKLTIPHSPSEIAAACLASEIEILSVKPDHLDELRDLPLIHKDPFDRLIIAQAKYERLAVVTSDCNIGKYQVETLWLQ